MGSYSPYLKTSTSHYRAPLLLNSTDCTLKPPENRKKIGLKRRQSHQWSPCTTIRSPTFEPLEQGLQGPPVRVEERAVMVLDIVFEEIRTSQPQVHLDHQRDMMSTVMEHPPTNELAAVCARTPSKDRGKSVVTPG